MQQLVNVGDEILPEAMPHDPVWGIGFRVDDTEVFLPPPHKSALNLVGDTLMGINRKLDPYRSPPLRLHRILSKYNLRDLRSHSISDRDLNLGLTSSPPKTSRRHVLWSVPFYRELTYSLHL